MGNKVIDLNPHAAADWQVIADNIFMELRGHKTAQGYEVHCPSHEDLEPSLSICAKHDRLLWHCKAGCSQETVREALIQLQLYPAKQPPRKDEILAVYDYGVFQKFRKNGQKGAYRYRGTDGDWIYKKPLGVVAPLYKFELISQFPKATVVICEGEKDVDNFNALRLTDYVAITNAGGASEQWRSDWIAALKGRNIVLMEDNDDAGRKRTELLKEKLKNQPSLKLIRFLNLPEKGDFSDWLLINGAEKIQELLNSAETLEVEPPEFTPSANREDYFKLFEEILGPLPRDIFTGNCMVSRDGVWVNAWNMLDKVKSEADSIATAKIMAFKQTIIDSHFFEYEDRKKPELLIKTPKWDGIDRIKAYTDCLILDGSQKFPNDIVERYTKAWIAGVFRKLDDPRYQNPILILRSKKQGIGKDTWVNALTDGFGQWASHFNITQNERDNYLELSHSAVLKIGEFDKTTSKHEMNVIKDMIFRDTTRLRASHAKKAEHRICRASFIATCNPEDFYRDPTGHRRFAVFNLRRIDFSYSRSPETSLQILAQARELAESNYTLPQMHIDAMMEFLEGKTPQSDDDFIVDTWCTVCSEIPNADIVARKWITNAEATTLGIFERIVKLCGFRLKTIQTVLKARGFGRNERITGVRQRGYAFGTDLMCSDTDDDDVF